MKEEATAQRLEQARLLKAEKNGTSATDEAADSIPEDEEVLLDIDSDEDGDLDTGDSNPMAALLASARARAIDYDQRDSNGDEMEEDSDDFDAEDASGNGVQQKGKAKADTSRRAFNSYFNELVTSADVILYVLDARDPLGTRSRSIERQIMAADSGSKRLILILNKIDLVPPRVLKAWLLHLRRYFPTLPLRASNPAANAKTWDHKALTVKGTAETLVKALKSYAAHQHTKGSIRVGIVGYPNVGKSSVINALRSCLGSRNEACPTGAEAGVTTSLREVKLDGKIKLIDSPGIVFPSLDESPLDNITRAKSAAERKVEQQAKLVLLNAVPPKEIDDPVPAATLLLSRLTALSNPASSESGASTPLDAMLKFYGIPALMPTITTNGTKDPTTDFLVQVARKRGRLGKGGVPNLNAAAFTVITDWRDGRIQGWVEAPKMLFDTDRTKDVVMDGAEEGDEPEEISAKDQKKIVTEWAAEFKLEGLWGDSGGVDGDLDVTGT